MVAYHEWCAIFPEWFVTSVGMVGMSKGFNFDQDGVIYYRDAAWHAPQDFVECNMIAGAEKL